MKANKTFLILISVVFITGCQRRQPCVYLENKSSVAFSNEEKLCMDIDNLKERKIKLMVYVDNRLPSLINQEANFILQIPKDTSQFLIMIFLDQDSRESNVFFDKKLRIVSFARYRYELLRFISNSVRRGSLSEFVTKLVEYLRYQGRLDSIAVRRAIENIKECCFRSCT